MDIFNLIPSKDVADYCKKIGHSFNSLELACIIYNQRYVNSMSIPEQNTLYQEIIDDYPDMQFHKSVRFSVRSSVHEYLKALIKWNEAALDYFWNPNKNGRKLYYYELCAYDIGDLGLGAPVDPIKDVFKEHDEYKRFNSVEDLITDIRPYWDKATDRDCIRIVTNAKGRKFPRFYADINRKGDIIALDDYKRIAGAINPGSLSHIHINIPVPFKAGDVVYSAIHSEGPRIIYSLPAQFVDSENLSGVWHQYYYSKTHIEDYVTFTHKTEQGYWVKDALGLDPCYVTGKPSCNAYCRFQVAFWWL